VVVIPDVWCGWCSWWGTAHTDVVVLAWRAVVGVPRRARWRVTPRVGVGGWAAWWQPVPACVPVAGWRSLFPLASPSCGLTPALLLWRQRIP
jgi:hypothetical protein